MLWGSGEAFLGPIGIVVSRLTKSTSNNREVRVLKHYVSPSIISVKIGVLHEPILERSSIETTDCPGWM